ncbi:hypothetical protein LTR10_015356 [Elasticomyces elasticus]|uniref:Amidohydrolase-related domain-containing protein n=1 Tax=Exophiala sideris TaxID=1016849 RepID=A0ABR0JJG7_9EURO|nr:hypothetical protein LTR10_015356 [Elasticomyces elasticus]KAK5030244.1 hypothetical protein LTR13_008262 [Exophiala sideris]KAK5035100.1 hypothetical protein LTS07_002536 [Exophiala sideris]KAK5066023.1 hypothetical protein LTR69_002541 [Exophiala sideris]KAK5178309.1 hypothetical protein LTR44_009184 [Eurotiomycetes sp. CCFEE 6388]
MLSAIWFTNYKSDACATLCFSNQVMACAMHGGYGPNFDPIAVAAENRKVREKRDVCNTTKVAIKNVQIFDGLQLLPPSTVVIDGNTIGTDPEGAEVIDATGLTLLPGLIDSHCHPDNVTHLESLTSYGVTTAFEMATFVPALGESLKNHSGLTDIFLASAPACAPGSAHGNITAARDASLLINASSEVPAWLQRQLSWNPDLVKIIAESPGLNQSTLNLLTQASHENNKRVICHIGTYDGAVQAMAAGADMIHHSTLDKPITADIAYEILLKQQVSVPTLAIMKAILTIKPQVSYRSAQETVTLLHQAGVPILAGTDANLQQGVLVEVPFGSSLHEELGLLSAAGMTNREVLNVATIRAAEYWGLKDRGRIAPGLRADLLLIEGNPLQNLTATRNIKKVWVNGVEYSGPLGQ